MNPDEEKKEEYPVPPPAAAPAARPTAAQTYLNTVFVLLIILGAALIVMIGMSGGNRVAREEQSPTTELVHEVTESPAPDPFADIQLDAKAVYIYDLRANKEIYGRNEEVQLPLASITKLMSVLAALPYMENDDTVTIDYDSLDQEGDSGLFAFEEWSVKDLRDFTLVVSSNDGASALALAAGGSKMVRSGGPDDTPESLFLDEMNDTAQKIGLTQTYFINETGLDLSGATSGGYGSARDVSALLAYILTHDSTIVEATAYPVLEFTSRSNFSHTATNTNEAIGGIPGLIASKTGFTDLAGGNLVFAFDAGINRPIIVSILGSTKEGRFTDAEKLVAATLKSL